MTTSGHFTLVDPAAASNNGTGFSRPEDAAWDPTHPTDLYFVTTDRLDTLTDGVGSQVGRSRVWRARLDSIANPLAGGTVDMLLDGTEGGNMYDNIAVDRHGRVILLEDVGNAAHNGKVWMYEIATDRLVQIAKHDPAKFGDINIPATAPFNQDEETSGVIDVAGILGDGWFLLDDQAHYLINAQNPNGFANPNELVEGGQLMQLFVPPPPTVASTRINDGSPQRSKVNEVTIRLNGVVAPAGVLAGAFTLVRDEGGTFAAFAKSVTASGGSTEIVLGFSSNLLVGSSLPDGHYTLTINGSKVVDALGQGTDANNDSVAGGGRQLSFATLFGDLNGDGEVDVDEVVESAHANGAHADYIWYLDYNGDGEIDGRDHSQVARRHN